MLNQTRKPAEALVAHQKALAIRQKLADANPAVTELQRAVAASLGKTGITLSRTGNPEEALRASRNALLIQQKLADAHPAVAEYQFDLAWCNGQLGWLLARQKRFVEALPAFDAGLAIQQKVVKENPKNTFYADDLGENHARRGWVLVRSGQPSQATANLRRAIELWANDAALDLEVPFERPRTLALLAGLGAEAKSGVTPAEAAAFADKAVAALRDAISSGWNEPDLLKEPDFDALRSRADFQKLLAEVEAKVEPNAKTKD